MKTLASIFFAIVAIAIAIYNNEFMLSRLSKHITPFTNTLLYSNSARNMSNTTTMFRGLPVIPDEPFTTDAPRKIAKSFLAIEQSEGAGARVRRSVGTPKLRNFSPFLMLDHFTIPPGAGFPDRKFPSNNLSHSPPMIYHISLQLLATFPSNELSHFQY
jgi:quercetin 2,3-dioxygenase